jgi:hypothetical protein
MLIWTISHFRYCALLQVTWARARGAPSMQQQPFRGAMSRTSLQSLERGSENIHITTHKTKTALYRKANHRKQFTASNSMAALGGARDAAHRWARAWN